MKRKYRINATAVWHVHVGGGDEHKLDPLGYVVKETADGRWFYRIDVGSMMIADTRFASEFVKITEEKNAIGRLRKLIIDTFDPAQKSTWYHRAQVSNTFYDTYQSKVNDLALNNQLIVQCLPFAAGKTYLPGSSIKGAIRTAVLDSLASNIGYKNTIAEIRKRLEQKNNLKPSSEAEKFLLNYTQIQQDPFKAIRLTDAVLPKDSTIIIEVKNVPKDSDPLSLDMFVEVVKPNTEFEFFITSEDEAGMQGINFSSAGLTIDKVMENCRSYYLDAITDEADKFYSIDSPADKQVQKALLTVYDDKDCLVPGTSLIRIGRFSHLESMTYNNRGEDKLCRPKPPTDPKTLKPKPWGTTRNLVDGKYPLGAISMVYFEEK